MTQASPHPAGPPRTGGSRESRRCAVGLVTWNGGRDLEPCVRSLLSQDEPLEIAWIDNASSDGSVEAARAAFGPPDAGDSRRPGNRLPEPRVLERNTGFCGGHDLGFSTTRAPYYLALNQDAFLAPDYARRLCDWMDEEPTLAMASGLLLETEQASASGPQGPLLPERERARVYSAGMAMTRTRFPYELGMGRPAADVPRARRFVPAVTGAAMLIRRSAILGGAGESPLPGGDPIFPLSFFAYFEEVDLALRLTETGFRCGVEGDALAWHAARGRGGRGRPAIRARYFANHWLAVLRHAGPGELLHDLPWLLKGKLTRYLPQYLREPLAAARSIVPLLQGVPEAVRVRREIARLHPDSRARRDRFFEESRRLLRDGG